MKQIGRNLGAPLLKREFKGAGLPHHNKEFPSTTLLPDNTDLFNVASYLIF